VKLPYYKAHEKFRLLELNKFDWFSKIFCRMEVSLYINIIKSAVKFTLFWIVLQ